VAKPHKVHIIKTRLKSGELAEYHYAWRGGPRIIGKIGSTEYYRSLSDHLNAAPARHTGQFMALIMAFQKSGDYQKLGKHTKRAYQTHLDQIKTRFGDMPIEALDDKRVRRHFIAFRDEFSGSPRTADMAIGTLKRCLSWCTESGYLETNQAEPIRRLYRVNKSEDVWEASDIASFNEVATEPLKWAVALGLLTGLRQGDLVRLAWTNIKDDAIVVRTSKRGQSAMIPIFAETRCLLNSIPKRAVTVLTNSRGNPWTGDGLRASFKDACNQAGIKRTFHDLRRTTATYWLTNGIDAARVALLMGWSQNDVEALQRIYVSRSKIVESVLATINSQGYEDKPKTIFVK
jgi:integrase